MRIIPSLPFFATICGKYTRFCAEVMPMKAVFLASFQAIKKALTHAGQRLFINTTH
ncbi:Hypothetical protein ABZS17G119_00424 [Kosakonia cowanii]